ncbi:hypothetical protein [Vibrio chagasii]|uniref:hypothetical protein n=1 Tax=Vibrio chagasii TaxID=170679 RepID=UPI003DA16460
MMTERHINALAKASLETSNIQIGKWYASYGLPLHLFKSDEKIYQKALKKRNGNKKHIQKYVEPKLLTVEGVTQELRNTKRLKTYTERWNKYFNPIADPKHRTHHLSEVLEALADNDIEKALEAVTNLPEDYLIHEEFWGKVVLFIISALSGEQAHAQAITQELFNMAQSEHNTAILSNFLPAICEKYLEPEYLPWQMKSKTVTWQGETYYCEPVAVHNMDAFGGEEYINNTSAKQRAYVERKHTPNYVYSYDRYGNKGQSGLSLTTNAAISTANAVGKLAANALILTVGGALYIMLAGKIRAYHYANSSHKMVFKRSVEMPVNSCGYLVSKQSNTLKPLQNEESEASISQDYSFLNFADGIAYPCRKGYEIPDEEGLIELLSSEASDIRQ